MSPRRHQFPRAAPDTDHGDDWRDRAACLGHDPELWYSTVHSDRDEARAICGACPVKAQCAVVGTGEQFGIWAGLSKEKVYRDEQPMHSACPVCGVMYFSSRMIRHTKDAHGTCPARHDLTASDTTTSRGECKRCRQAKDTNRRRVQTERAVVKGTCSNGHDTSAPDARYATGGCKQCTRDASRARRERAKATTCRHGHDVSADNARYANGDCKACRTEAEARRRKANQAQIAAMNREAS